MKKILPLLTIVGVGLFITGCSNNITAVRAQAEDNNIIIENETELGSTSAENKTVQNKYSVSIETPSTLELTEDNLVENTVPNTETNEGSVNEEELTNTDTEESENNNDENNEISTLYSLSNDVENSCEDFCELKEELSEAIIETEKLIAKIESKEIDLTREQRLTINEQAMQLKNLSKQLSAKVTELSYNLSDLKQILTENNADMNQLSLKYLIVLDNLVNSNEMIQTGLNSLNLMNSMFAKNNQGNRMIFGYKQNDQPAVFKDYIVNENGELVENTNPETIKQSDSNNKDNNNILDSYAENKLASNIDSYHSNNPTNIDSFFNTALLDNEFMYGNKGMGGFGYGFNPYMNQYANYENYNQHNSTNSVNNTQNTPYEQQVDMDNEKLGNKEKKLKLKKNIDTYRDENTPDLKTRFNSFKENISNSLAKINPKDNLKNPVYKF